MSVAEGILIIGVNIMDNLDQKLEQLIFAIEQEDYQRSLDLAKEAYQLSESTDNEGGNLDELLEYLSAVIDSAQRQIENQKYKNTLIEEIVNFRS